MQTKQARSLKRPTKNIPPYPRLLIVTEGSKTEPGYFKEIRQAVRLHTSRTFICPSDWGTDPLSVVNYAEHVFTQGRDNGHGKQEAIPKAFDRIYAVFDRDDHATYDGALTKARFLDGKLKNDNKEPVSFTAVPSNPCFELWLLLHYQKQLHWIDRTEIFKRLKTYWPAYTKGYSEIYKTLSPNLEKAIKPAREINREGSPVSTTYCYTKVVDLVYTLISIKRQTAI